MAANIRLLGIVLIAQIGLVFWLNSGGSELAAFSSDEAFFAVNKDAVTGIAISGDDKKLELKRVDGKWIIPAYFNFPAAEKKISKFFDQLLEIKRGWPVAQTDEAAKQFKLKTEEFERKIVFSEGDKELPAVLLGTSPGFKKVHARLADEKAIFAIPFSTFEAQPEATDWISKDLLELNSGDIQAITLPELKLVRKETELVPDGLTDSEQAKKSELGSLVGAVTSLSIEAVLGTEEKPEYSALAKVIDYSITLKDGTTRQISARGPLEELYYVLTSSSHPYFFKVRKQKLDRIKAAKREELVEPKAAQAAPEVKDQVEIVGPANSSDNQ